MSIDGKNILFVNADLQFARIVREDLADSGHNVMHAVTSGEATMLLLHRKPDLIVVDGDVRDCFNWINEVRIFDANVEIIFLVGVCQDTPSYLRLNSELQIHLVIHKPVLPSTLASHIQCTLTRSPSVNRAKLKPRVLVLDHDQRFLRNVGMLLACEEMECLTFSDSRAFPELMATVNPDLLLIGLETTGMTQSDASRALGLTDRWRHLPVVLLTEQATGSLQKAGGELGAIGSLSRQAQKQEVISTIRLCLLDSQTLLHRRMQTAGSAA